MVRMTVLSDAQWETIAELLSPERPRLWRPRRSNRQVVDGIVYRYRCGLAWRDLPEGFGPWQTAWKRHRRWSADGTWDKVLAALQVRADAEGRLDWTVAGDSTVCRAHQDSATLPRHTGGSVESQQSARRTT
ncbi:IS5 family transposase [Dietzia aerolata]|uniref:IS5 family transposase n=1 Tax=Dietzia aerolata TaxID=595984 RepID=A0ABV5JN37_9ACTN|nr:IS5 family transposase [Dietzia aerolata]MBB0970165.1 IS5 family transposase [Dietzia aerolata]HIW69043.1 IS5 family transposase [Candidatus Dietzia merdigallinarum]